MNMDYHQILGYHPMLFNRYSSYTSMVQKMERVIRERWVLGLWSRQMNLESSSKKKGRGNFPQVESPGKLGKGFGIACQSVVRASEEDSKSSPTTMPKCYHTNCRLGKSRPNPQDGENYGNTYPLSP
jgi:hypothetical protein